MPLDAKSEQVREVYAYFGLAMYWAQCLEQSIFQHLLFFDHFPRAVTSYTTPEKWAEDFDQYERQELGQTMGKLIRRLREAGNPTTEIEQTLNDALKHRNWLEHGYFADRALEFTLQEGRERMIVELESLRDKFRDCSAQLDAITLPLAQKAGLTEERLAQVQAEMLEAYAGSRAEG
jgi:hypothetical protein